MALAPATVQRMPAHLSRAPTCLHPASTTPDEMHRPLARKLRCSRNTKPRAGGVVEPDRQRGPPAGTTLTGPQPVFVVPCRPVCVEGFLHGERWQTERSEPIANLQSDLFERRRLLMDNWAAYLDGHADEGDAALRRGGRTFGAQPGAGHRRRRRAGTAAATS